MSTTSDAYIHSEDLGDVLRRYRELRGLSQPKLADATGLSQSAIAAYERGVRYPTVLVLRLLIRTLRIPPTEVL